MSSSPIATREDVNEFMEDLEKEIEAIIKQTHEELAAQLDFDIEGVKFSAKPELQEFAEHIHRLVNIKLYFLKKGMTRAVATLIASSSAALLNQNRLHGSVERSMN